MAKLLPNELVETTLMVDTDVLVIQKSGESTAKYITGANLLASLPVDEVGALKEVDVGFGNVGWTLQCRIDDVNAAYGVLGDGAVDFSAAWEGPGKGATGVHSFAVGSNVTASGEQSFAMGRYTAVSGDQSFASGRDSTVSGTASFVTGNENIVVGNYSFASGNLTQNHGNQSHVEGHGGINYGNDGHVQNHYGYIGVNAHACHVEGFGNTLSMSIANASSVLASYGGTRVVPPGGGLTEFEGAHASGMHTFARGNGAFVAGYGTIADGGNEQKGKTAMGTYNDPEAESVFTIGIGTSDAEIDRANGLCVYEKWADGVVTAPSADIEAAVAGFWPDAKKDTILITKGYADENYGGGGASELEKVTESDGESTSTGWRLLGRVAANHGQIGDNAIDLTYSFGVSSVNGALGPYSFATGYETRAFGIASTAMGQGSEVQGWGSFACGLDNVSIGSQASFACGEQNTASGNRAFASGFSTTASGIEATAMGSDTTASGNYSFACGNTTTAAASSSFAAGVGTKTNETGQFAIGQYNVDQVGGLFEVGYGTSDVARANHFEVFKSGRVRAPELTPTRINSDLENSVSGFGDRTLVTREYLFSAEFGSSLPTVDPGSPGQLWNNNGVVTVSDSAAE